MADVPGILNLEEPGFSANRADPPLPLSLSWIFFLRLMDFTANLEHRRISLFDPASYTAK